MPVTPFRILDTRSGSPYQRGAGALGAGATRTLQISGVTGLPIGTDPIPATATAVSINVTAVAGTATSLLTVYPNGTGRPNASNLNFTAGAVTPNLVTVVLGESGAVNIFNAVGTVNVVADVEGYFEPQSSSDVTGQYHPMAPVRVCDTRTTRYACGARGALVGAVPRLVNVTGAGAGDIPTSGVQAAVLNLTGVAGTAATYLSVYPPTSAGACTSPGISTLNLAAGHVQANRVMVALGPATTGAADTSVCVYSAAGAINVVLDAGGWFADSSGPPGDQYQPIGPSRICDTRSGSGQPCAGHPIAARGIQTVQVASKGGVPATGEGTPPLAVIANVTAIAPPAPTYVTVYPASETTTPGVSDINMQAGAVLGNLAAVELGTGSGAIDVFSAASAVNVVIDVEGWFQ